MSLARLLPRLALATITGAALLLPTGALASGAPKQGAVTLHLGYFPNVTHASAIVGVEGASSSRSSATT
jgi:NitT/TauT family transport system substrate-binding protein